jgi:hypothetical protein
LTLRARLAFIMRPNRILNVLAVICVTSFVHGTSFYAVRHEGVVYFGGDILVRVADYPKINIHQCKMFVSDKLLVGAVGNYGAVQPDPTSVVNGQPTRGSMDLTFFNKINAVLKKKESIAKTIQEIITTTEMMDREYFKRRDRTKTAPDKTAFYLVWLNGTTPMERVVEIIPIVQAGRLTFKPPHDVINRELKEDLVTGVSSTKAQRDLRGPTPLEMNRNPLGGIDRLLKLESTLNEEGSALLLPSTNSTFSADRGSTMIRTSANKTPISHQSIDIDFASYPGRGTRDAGVEDPP